MKKILLSAVVLSISLASCEKWNEKPEAGSISLAQTNASVSESKAVVTTFVTGYGLVSSYTHQIKIGPDNSLYADRFYWEIIKRTKGGKISTVIRDLEDTFGIDGFDVAENGTVYYFGTEYYSKVLAKVDPDCKRVVILKGYDISAISVQKDGSIYAINSGTSQLIKISGNTVTVIATHPELRYINNNIVVGADKSVYVAGYHQIFKITPSGVVSTFAGSNLPYNSGGGGYVDGPGTSAKFDFLTGMTMDSEGNLFVVDHSNSRIRQITPAGFVSTLVGGAVSDQEYLDGVGTNAKLSELTWGITIDKNDVLYISDWSSRVAKITYK
jgi:hypothetical protein